MRSLANRNLFARTILNLPCLRPSVGLRAFALLGELAHLFTFALSTPVNLNQFLVRELLGACFRETMIGS